MKSRALDRFFANDNRIYFYLTVCALFAGLIVVSPVLSSGYTNDDSLNSLIKGELAMNGQSFLSYPANFCINILSKVGRFYPLASISPLSASYIDLGLSKWLVLALIAVDLLMFAYFIWIFTGSKNMAILSLLLVPLSIQFRLYHDPVMGYTFLLQFILFLLLSSFILLALYMDNGKKIYLASSIAIYFICLMFGEISYLFFLVHIAIIFFKAKNRDYRQMVTISSLFLLMVAIIVAIPVSLRLIQGIPLMGESGANQYVVSTDLMSALSVFIRQVVSAVPLSYYLINPNGIFGGRLTSFISHITIVTLLLAVGYFLLSTELTSRLFSESAAGTIQETPMKRVFILGLLLLIVPAMLISLLPKYQTEVIWGFGYIYGFISCFGMAAIVLYLFFQINKVLSHAPKRFFFTFILLASLTLAVVGIINYSSNAMVVEKSDQYWLYPRGIAEDAMKEGLFKNVSNGSVLLVDSHYPWDQQPFYFMGSGIRFAGVSASGNISYANVPGDDISGVINNKIINISEGNDLVFCNGSPGIFYLRYFSDSPTTGYAVLAKPTYILVSGQKINGVTAKDYYVYARCQSLHNADYFQQGGYVVLTASELDQNLTVSGTAIINEDNMTLISSGDGWKLLSVHSDNLLDTKSLSVSISPHYILASTF